MAKSSRNMYFSFSKCRRNPLGMNSTLCMMWINKMVNKQVVKQIAEVRRELFLVNQALREEMVAALQDQLRELSVDDPGERPLHCRKLDQVLSLASRWQRGMAEEYENIDEDEGDAAKSLSRKTLAFPETLSDTHSLFTVRKSQKKDCLSISLSSDSSDTDSSDGDTSEGETSDVQTNPGLTKGGQQKNQSCSPDVTPAFGASQSIKEGDRTRIPFHAKPNFMCNELSHEDEKDHVDNRKDEAPLLMTEEDWKEWLDTQEMIGNHHKKKPVENQENTEKQGAAASGVSETHKQQNMRRGDTVKKIKTYISHFFSSRSSYKWKKFENED